MQSRPALERTLAVVAAAFISACSSAPSVTTPPPPPPAPTVASVTVSPVVDTLIAIGATRQLSAVAKDAAGAVITGKTFAWSSSAPGVVVVDPASGLATAKGPGSATLSASVEGRSGEAQLVVDQQVTSVVVTPGTAGLVSLGATQQFVAVAKDANGNTVAGVPFLWISSDATVATVDNSGLVTSKGSGSAVIIAAAKGIPGSAQLTVTQEATQLAFTAFPASATEGIPFFATVQVAVRDATGALVTGSPRLVTLNIGTNPSGGTLIGPKSQITVGGLATFSGLSIDKAGTGYTLTATSTGLNTAVTSSLSVFLNFTQLAAGFSEACGVTARDESYCWGTGTLGQLGDGTTTSHAAPTRVATPGGVTFYRMHPGQGANMACAITGFGSGYCWGLGSGGESGTGVAANTTTPQLVAAPAGVVFASMSSAGGHTCALTPGGMAYCWGQNGSRQLGDGTTTIRLAPVPVVMPGGVSFTQIGAGSQFSCGMTAAGVAYCWGLNSSGQLGDGTTVDRAAPTIVATPGAVKFSSISVGAGHGCGLTPAAAVYCWGDNTFGAIGDGTTTNRPTPTLITTPAGVTFVSLSAGALETCALTAAGTVYCWGLNNVGEIGDGTTVNRLVPVPVTMPVGALFSSVSVGNQFACATTPNFGGYCWGFVPSSGSASLTPVHVLR